MKKFVRSNKLVEKHYDDALRIAGSFRTKFLLQDDKEGVALLALIRASRTFKKEKMVKFNTHLYNVIWNALRNSVNRAKKRGPIFHNRRVVQLDEPTKKRKFPRYELKFDDFDPYRLRRRNQGNSGEFLTLFDLLADKDNGDPLVLKEFLFLVRKCLTDKQNKILNFYFDPFELRQELIDLDREAGLKELTIQRRYNNFKNLTYNKIGKALRCTRQRVGQQMEIIREVFKRVRQEQGSENFKLTKEDQGELYGQKT